MTGSSSGSPFVTSLRSHLAGSLRAADSGAHVRLGGWVHRSRNLGGIVFIDLRDREGIVQVSFGTDWASAECIASAAAVGVESVVVIEGTVVARTAETRNGMLEAAAAFRAAGLEHPKHFVAVTGAGSQRLFSGMRCSGDMPAIRQLRHFRRRWRYL